MSGSSQPGNNGPGQIISSVRSIRLAIFLVTTSLIAACAVFNVIDFQPESQPLVVDFDVVEVDENITNVNMTNATTFSTLAPSPPQGMPQDISPVYLFLCGLSVSAISAFLRADFILKLFMMILTVSIQTAVLYTSRVFENYELFSDSL